MIAARRGGGALLAFLLTFAASAAEPTLPALSGRVVDGARILSAAVETQLTELLAAHERETSNQVVAATLPSLQGYEIEDFSVRLFRAWKLGTQDRNNGVLLLVAPNERRVRIEVGYGLEGALPDATANAIIQTEILPRFRAGEMEDGVVRGTRAILAAIAGTYKPRSGTGVDPQYDKLLVIFVSMFFLALLYNGFEYFRDPRRRGYGPWDDDIYWPGRRRRRFGGYGGGGGFGGRSGGGFSGGGGSSGGGGASGRW